jgi:RHS repeat-associated protein
MSRITSAIIPRDCVATLYQSAGGTPGTTRFGYDGTALIAEYNSSNTLQRRYVHGPATDEPIVWYEGSGTTDRRFLHTDERGSVVAVGGSAGTSVNTYDEYGIPRSSNTGRFQYTGQAWLAELGMYYYKARIYSPTMGRFLQTDPIGLGGGMNLYAYVGADPANYTDPMGLAPCPAGEHRETPTGSHIAHCTKDGVPPEAPGTDTNPAALLSQAGGSLAGGLVCVKWCDNTPAFETADHGEEVHAPPQYAWAPGTQAFFFDGTRFRQDPFYQKPWYSGWVDGGVSGLVAGPVLVMGSIEAVGALGVDVIAFEGPQVGYRLYGVGRMAQIRFFTNRLILRIDVRDPITHLNIQGRLFGAPFNWHIPPF